MLTPQVSHDGGRATLCPEADWIIRKTARGEQTLLHAWWTLKAYMAESENGRAIIPH